MMYLNRTTRSTILHPEVVEVEGDEAEDGDVEEDLPAREEAAVAVDPCCPAVLDRFGGGGRNQGVNVS